MKPKTKRTESAEPFLVAADEGQTPVAGFPLDFQELFCLGLDRALAIQKQSLAAAVCLHSCAIDIYKSGSCLAPEFGAFLDMVAKSFAHCLEMHSNWLTLLSPLGTTADSYGSQAAPTQDELADHMDIACGHKSTVPHRMVASSKAGSSGRRTRTVARPAEAAAASMDIVLGERAA